MSEIIRELLARERLALMVGLGSLTEAKRTAQKLLEEGDALVYASNRQDLDACIDELEFLWTLDYLEGKTQPESRPPCLRPALLKAFRYEHQLSDKYLRPVAANEPASPLLHH